MPGARLASLLLLSLASLGLPAGPVAADAAHEVIVMSPEGWREGGGGPWSAGLARAARRQGRRPVLDPLPWASALGGGVDRARLTSLRRVETLLVRARRAAAALKEGQALAELARARALMRAHADIPGASAWLGEVYTLVGIVAAQSGRQALAEQALYAAATLDPGRGLRAAEATPGLVARAHALARSAAARPGGVFEVRADAPEARVYLDEELVGRAPVRVRASVGPHVLRVEAPGRLAWGQVVEVLEGPRPSVAVHLHPTPAVEAVRRLSRAVSEGDLAAVPGVLAGQARRGRRWTAWLVIPGAGPRQRALLVACEASGCSSPRRLEADRPWGDLPLGGELSGAQAARQLARARPWLSEPPAAPPPPAPWYARWYTWATAGVVGAAVATSAALLLRPDAATRRRTVIDPGDLGTAR